MDRLILFRTFTDVEELQLIIKLLKSNRFDYETININVDNETIIINNEKGSIKILESKLDNAYKLMELYSKADSSNKEVFFFDDTEIMKISLNNNDFDKIRVKCANEIKSLRNIHMPFKRLISLIDKKDIKKIDPEKAIINGANWFLWIGIISILNTIAILSNQNFSFITGLNYTYFFLGVMDGINKATGINLMWFGYVLSFVSSLLFIFLWHKSKNLKKSFYLIGLILYTIDTLPPLITKDFFNFGFHVFALWFLFVGYSQFKKINENES
jgi:hypothetical protein